MNLKYVVLMSALVFISGILAACGQTEGPVVVATLLPSLAPESPSAPSPVGESSTPEEPTATSEEEAHPPPRPTLPIAGDAYPPALPVVPEGPTSYPEPDTSTPTHVKDLSAVRLELERVLMGLESPVAIAHAGDGSDRLFVVEKAGKIRVVRDGALDPLTFLDIEDRVGSEGNEQGLLGLAFDPAYAENGRLFVNYTDGSGATVVSRFTVSSDPERADVSSEIVVLTQDQPAGNHNGGHLAFGPDGYLYVGLGDGGGGGDRFGNGQNGQTWLGAMLRLDVSGESYAVPPDNPFVGDDAVRDEIWAIGLRNPWRYAFDRATGDLYIADVGQNKYEEVHVQPASGRGGENYGWPVLEGSHCYPDDDGRCDRDGLQLPVIEYDHSQGCSITGGTVYRGDDYPVLRGVYLFGDYCSGRIWGLALSAEANWQVEELAEFDHQISSFGENERGDLFLTAMDSGELYEIKSR